MHPLTSMAYLSKIAEYQDGIRHKDMKIQPDLAAKAGHVNLLAMKDCFKPTPDAYAATMEQKDPCRTVEHLMNTGIPSDFILGDEASSRGHLDIIKNLLNVKYQKGDQCKHKYHQCHHPFSFKAFRNAISGGHLEILQLLCAYTSADLTHFYPSMYALAAASSQEVVMDWLYNIAGQNGVVPLSIQYDSLVYHIQHCGVDVTPTVRQRHEQRVFHLLAVNPTLLIQCSGLRSGTKAVDCCAAVGNLSLLKVMFAYHGRESHCALDHAAKNGFLPVVRYLTGEGEEDEDEEEDNNDGNGSWSSSGNASGIATPAVSVLDTNTAADNAADAGSNVTDTNSHAQAPEVMMEVDVGVGGDYVYLLTPSVTHRRGKYTIHATNRAITEAAIANHVAVVDYLATHRYEGADNRMFDLVAAEGHLAMLMYISAHLNDHFPNVVITTDALDNAAANGHLSVVQYLTEDPLRHEGGTTDAMDRAAANGHLECLQWLYFNRPEGCTTEAFDSAAANNQKEVVEWLREQAEIIRSSGSAVNANARLHGTARAIDLAAGNGHVDMVRWLHDNYHQHCRSTSVNTLNSPVSTSLGFLSPLYYHLNSSIYQSHGSAHESHDLSCEDSNVVQGNAGVLQQPQPTLPIPTRLAYDSAAGNGHLDVLKYLLENYENLLSVSTVELAARGGHVLVLQWMYENYADMFMPTYSDSDYGYFDGLHHSPSKPTTATGGVVATPAVRVGGGSGSANSRSSKRLKTVRESYDLTTAPVAEALSLAIRHGQCQAVRWLLTTLRMQPTESDIDWAARNGHLAMLLLLQEYCNSFADTIRPSLKSLEWSVLNGHIAVVQYLLRLRDNRLEARQDQMTSGGEERPVDFSAKQAAIYARRYGQDELLLLLDHYIPHVNRSTAESSTTSSFSSFTASPPSNIVPPLTHSVATTTADMGNLNDITSVLVHSPSLVLFSSSTE